MTGKLELAVCTPLNRGVYEKGNATSNNQRNSQRSKQPEKDHCDFVSLHRPFLVGDETFGVTQK